jgi:hypothetical protein
MIVSSESVIERLADGRHLALVESALAEDRCKAGCQERPVALTQRDVEALGEVKEHLAGGPRAPAQPRSFTP